MFKDIKLTNKDIQNTIPVEKRTVKPQTAISMQTTLNNALGSRAPQNNGASIQQPASVDGFGRTN